MKLPYECRGYISASKMGSGILYPIYTLGNLNFEFVQEIGRDGGITAFVPFYDIENFRVFPTSTGIMRGISSTGLYAYLGSNGQLVESDHIEISKLARTEPKFFESSHIPILTRLAIARIGKAAEAIQIRLFKDFLGEGPASNRAVKILLAAQQRQFSTEKFWWDSQDDRIDTENDDLDGIALEDAEEVFRWLFDHQCSAKWVNQLSRLMKIIVFDQRFFDLLSKIILHKSDSDETFSRKEKFMISRGMEFYSGKDGGEEDFADIMHDFILSREIFSFASIAGINLIFSFIDKIDESGKLDGLAIDVYLEELSSEYISSEMANALIFRILDSRQLDQRYPEKSAMADHTRLSTLKAIVAGSGRIGLVVDRTVRQHVLRY
jgi:hypothetical protein